MTRRPASCKASNVVSRIALVPEAPSVRTADGRDSIRCLHSFREAFRHGGPTTSLAASLALLLLLATLWGASYTFIKIAVETIPPVTLIATRTLIAGSVLWAVLRLRGLRLPTDRRNLGRFFVQACLNSVVPFVLVAGDAVRRCGSGDDPQFSDAGLRLPHQLGHHAPRGVTGRKAFGVAAGLFGICLVVGPSALQGANQQLVAQLAIIVAAMAYGAAVTFGRTFRDLDPMMPAAGSLLFGAAILIPVSLVLDRPWTLAPSTASIAALARAVALLHGLGLTLYFFLLKRIGSVGVTAQAYLRVPIGVGIA